MEPEPPMDSPDRAARPIKLSELVEKRSRMTRGTWKIDDEYLDGLAVCDGACGDPTPATDHAHCQRVMAYGAMGNADTIGMVATHHTADVLISIVQAALHARDAQCTCGAYQDPHEALCACTMADNALFDALQSVE